MASTFFGLTIASSGLSTFQTAINTTANNISNVDTEGYSRQEAIKTAAEAIRVNAKYGSTGTGVEVTAISQMRDLYYDLKYWGNSSRLGEFQTKSYYLNQIETYFQDDDKVTGFSKIFSGMFDSLEELKKNPSSLDNRNSYISSALTLTDYFHSVSNQLTSLQEDINQVISTKTAMINGTAQKIATLNKQINLIEQKGGKANELRDERAVLIDDLSKLIPVEVKEEEVVNSNYPDRYTGMTTYTVKINGQTLVNSYEYNELECIPRGKDEKINVSDADGLYDLYWKNTSMKLETTAGTMSGEMKALFNLRDGNNSTFFSGEFNKIENYIKAGGGVASQITIMDPTITSPSQITMPPYGTITIKNVDFKYDSYQMIEQSDAAGNKTYSFQFQLSDKMEDGNVSKLMNQKAAVGTDVDFMGIPYYQTQMNEFIRNFTKTYNDLILKDGVDLNGQQTGVFFVTDDLANGGEYDYNSKQYTESITAGVTTRVYNSDYYYFHMNVQNISVTDEVIKDPRKLATSTKNEFTNGVSANDLLKKLSETKDKTIVFRGGVGEDFLQCLLSDVAVDTQKVKIFEDNYKNLSKAITNQRMSISGVDNDDEALTLVKYQNAYKLSSKLVSVLAEMYDRLILQTGV